MMLLAKRAALAVLAAAALADPALAADRPALVETPTLAETHPDGLPPVGERVPREPYVVDLSAAGREVGRHGGTLETIIGRTKDARLINVWGYARLVGYDQDLMLVPDILEDVEVEHGSTFTFHLREGHKWSDGHPFTAEDFRYYWEDIALNEELTPSGPPPFLTVNGDLPTFEVLDEHTVRFTWPEPNPQFLPQLAQARPPFIYRPAHYLKQFNPKYGDLQDIARMADAARVRGWAPLHNMRDEMYDAVNPDMPSLQPWVASRVGNDRRIVMVRNPYFHRVTSEGQQLPYIDRVIMSVADPSLIAAKTQAGEADLQARGLNFSDIPVLKKGEKERGYSTRLWPIAKANAIVLYPNLTTKDATWRAVLRDVRFRRALSHAVDRELVNRVFYFGLAYPSNNAVLPESPLFEERFRDAYTAFDTDEANRLLDEMGLAERTREGLRKLPDGRPMEIIVETAGENPIEIDALELVRDTWREIGIALYPRPSQRDVLRNRAFSGELVMSVWSGFDNGIPTAEMSPDERVPVSTVFLPGPAWGAFVMSHGETGEKPDFEPAARLLDLYDAWIASTEAADQARIWKDILSIHAEDVLSIGLVAGVSQPVVVSDRLRNVPEKGFYGWDPGAQFGIWRPDEFFFAAAQ